MNNVFLQVLVIINKNNYNVFQYKYHMLSLLVSSVGYFLFVIESEIFITRFVFSS